VIVFSLATKNENFQPPYNGFAMKIVPKSLELIITGAYHHILDYDP
jgi:hypothetical protein